MRKMNLDFLDIDFIDSKAKITLEKEQDSDFYFLNIEHQNKLFQTTTLTFTMDQAFLDKLKVALDSFQIINNNIEDLVEEMGVK